MKPIAVEKSAPMSSPTGSAAATAASATIPTANAAAAAPSDSSVSLADWSRHVQPGRLVMIDELIQRAKTNKPLPPPPAVRIIGQLSSFDASASVTNYKHEDEDGDKMMDEGEQENEGDAPNGVGTGYGVAVLRYKGCSIPIDTSLLQTSYAYGTLPTMMNDNNDDDESSSPAGLHFKLDAWYSVIGDVVHSQSSLFHLHVRARVCRALDESFDPTLYDESVKLRRSMRGLDA